MARRRSSLPTKILVIDIGGTHVKAGFAGTTHEIKIVSGPKMTPSAMVRELTKRLRGQRFDAVSIGYPGVVAHGRIVGEPQHLASGWVGFDFEAALRRPTRVINDAALQALGSYRGDRMLFLGLGTGLGSAMVADGQVLSMELAHLPFKKGRTFEEYVGEAALKRYGRRKWRREVLTVVGMLIKALEPDYTVIGGGNARLLKQLPPSCVLGDNRSVLLGGARLWSGSATVPRGPALRAGRSAPASRAGKPGRGASV